MTAPCEACHGYGYASGVGAATARDGGPPCPACYGTAEQLDGRRFLVDDTIGAELALELGWYDLALVNDEDVMAEIALIPENITTSLGHSWIRRVA